MKKNHNEMPYHRLRIFLRGLSDFLVHLFFRVRYVGLENIPDKGPVILIANHTSLVDMFAIHVRVRPWIHWVAKKELYRHPWLSALLTKLGCIPVNRDQADLSAARSIMRVLRQNQFVGIFPQGTRVTDDKIASVKPRQGAVRFAVKTGAPMLPVAIDGRFRLFGRVRIVFGRPFILDQHEWLQAGAQKLEALNLRMMQKVYDLIDRKHVYDQDIAMEEHKS